MANVWKIAPGEDAEDWDVFRDQQCIGLGWVRIRDFAIFTSEDHVLKELKKNWSGTEKEGNREGAARSIWYFVNSLQADDIIVANHGRGAVVGVGVITSDYLRPDSPKNPIRNDDRVWRRHVRRVEWVIDKRIELPETYFFGINAVTSLTPDKVHLIRQAYLRKDITIRKKLTHLFGPA